MDSKSFCASSSYNSPTRLLKPFKKEKDGHEDERVGKSIEEKEEDKGVHLFPNPTSGKTTMVFTLREASYSKMSILDFSGQVIATPVDQFSEAGEHALEFDASALAAGLNIIRVESNKLNKTEKLVVIK